MKTNKLYLTVLSGALLALGGCTADGPENDKTASGVDLTEFAMVVNLSGASDRIPQTRTSMDNHQYLAGGDFMWEIGDKIYVKDDNNTLQTSGTNSNITGKQPTARFRVPGKYSASNAYEVRYTGSSSSATASAVTISSAQLQASPNDTRHFGASGDCGTSTATRVDGRFEFMLDHKASYLCFLPRMTNADLGQNVYLTRIVVRSDNAIAGDYTLSLAGLSSTPTSNAATQITLTTQGAAHPNGFPLTNTATSVATNAAYMVIAPGTHTLTVDYYIKDPVTNVEGAITKILPVNKLFEANKVYDVTADLTPRDYSDRKYYMWDAKQNYWYQHEWDTTDPWQPTMNNGNNPNYPTSSDVNRWYNTAHNTSTSIQATNSAQACPNVNEMLWYAMQGDPHSDRETLWSTMGHLYKAGMWFKKKAKITGFNAVSYNGTDYRTVTITSADPIYNNSVISGKPSDITNYFYVPFLGRHVNGTINAIGSVGHYWTSNSNIWSNVQALDLHIDKNQAGIISYTRSNGVPNFYSE